MAYIRRRDRYKVGLKCLVDPERSALILKLKRGCKKKAKKLVPLFNFRGKRVY